jgi:FG-GAP repeat protein
LLASGLIGAGEVASAAVATCGAPSAGPYVLNSDIDGDGVQDVVVGTPRNATNAGFVVDGSRGVRQYVTRGMVTNVPTSSEFGMSLDARQDFNGDGCLVVGDPGVAGGGAVDIFWGSPNGVVTHAVTQIAARSSDDLYGTALATNFIKGFIDIGQFGPTRHDLWVGAPGRTVGGHASAGAIDQYRIAADGSASFQRSLTQNSTRDDVAATGNRFGAVMDVTVAEANDEELTWALLAGVPNETVNGHAQAGAADFLFSDGVLDSAADTSRASGYRLVQGSRSVEGGLAGVPETGDHFGFAVTIAHDQALIGVPDEDIGTTVNAGMVQTMWCCDFTTIVGIRSFSQATAGVPGVPEAGDRFGAAVAGGVVTPGAFCPSYLAIGAPGEDLAAKRDAGVVDVVKYAHCDSPTSAVGLSQGSAGGLGGAVEAGDRVGAVLHGMDGQFAIGVPGEDLGASVNTGVVLRYHLNHAPTTSFSDKGIPWVGFGRVIGY